MGACFLFFSAKQVFVDSLLYIYISTLYFQYFKFLYACRMAENGFAQQVIHIE